MTQVGRDTNLIHQYYTSLRSTRQGNRSIYDIWEDGGAFNDSITPSTYVREYRSHIVLKILSITEDHDEVFSLGCGNGFVEADLASADRRVRAIDCNVEAVELTRKKGVDAFVADFFQMLPEEIAEADVLYADGLLGHLFDTGDEIRPALRKMESFNLKSGTRLVFSNDSPRDGRDFAPHERVEGFWFLSRTYLQESLAAFGFEPVESYYFPYLRPVSGMRNRTICIAVVP